MLKEGKITEKEAHKIFDIIARSKEVQELRREMMSLVNEGMKRLKFVEGNTDLLKLLLQSPMETN